jgi:N-acetylglutamate synthase
MRIERFTTTDYSEAYALWEETDGVGLSSSDSPEHLLRFLTANAKSSFVARIDKVVAGTVLCGNDGRRGYIYHLAVLPKYRKMGVGRKLIDHCLNALSEEGIQKCHAFVFANNKNGRDFWQSLSWKERTDLIVFSKEPD